MYLAVFNLTLTDTTSTAEKSLLEISELQTTLANNLSVQAEHINQLVDDSFLTTENVGSGNKELKRATERKSTAQMVFYGTSVFCLTLVLWDQELEVERLQRRLGLRQPIVEVFSNDARLADLTAWDPAAEAVA